MDNPKRDTTSFRRLLSTFKSPAASASSSSSISSPSPSSAPSFKPFTVPMPNSKWKREQAKSTLTSHYGNSSSSRASAVGSRAFPRRTQHQTRPLGLSSGRELGLHDQDRDLPLDAFDRELLAQLENEKEQHQDVPETYVQDEESADLYGPTLGPGRPQNSSKFFQSSATAMDTPVRGNISSSTDIGPLSSPSLAVRARKRPPLFSRDVQNDEDEPNQSPFSANTISSQGSRNGAALSSSPLKSIGIQLNHAPPMIQGIRLVSTHELPDRFRSIFSFPVFNAIQSKCFRPIYQGDDNFVLSAPTGSGKTAVMELAICRLVTNVKDCRFKVVYQAPTKSLCSERFRDWQTKFSSLDLQCAELTGDTDYAQLRNVQNANIIITTPEKWDSMTRKWKDHIKLMQLVKLFLIDEVHILKETRGATLEAVVSRMKSVDSNVRFVALSATVPNSEDIGAWLGKDPTNQHLPAHRERFGEEFRPVKLQKFVYGYQGNGNDFAFDKACEGRLPEVMEKHSRKKPIMIFCCTRNSAIATSKYLAKLWTSTNPPRRLWSGPTKPVVVQNPELRATISTGVAFHHAGLDVSDRHAVENGFLSGQINVICCTSTLAVGVNLPCHLVIIKNTVSWQDNCCKEYQDLEMMQMLGRAGRPQFDDSAVAVILTRKERVNHYEKLVAGSEPLESCLHLNLIDHLNAEIGLGTVKDVESAVRWLTGTFFFIRLRKNPAHYKLKEGANRSDEEEMLKEVCEENIKRLQECSLITSEEPLRSTEFGDAMARYYVKFDTMRLFLSLPPKAKMSEILSVIAQADEFREIRLKAGEKSLYKELNKGNGIKFPIKIDIALPAHKISLLIQSELGSVDIPTGDQYQKHKLSFQQDKGLVFSHVSRLIRCITDCQISRQDSVSTRHALELARAIGARVWDNSALQMKQIEQIGIVAVRKLATAGINSIEALEATEPHRIDMLLSKNPPFGSRILTRLAEFPKPRVSVKLVRKDIKPGKSVRVNFKTEIGFINEQLPTFFRRKPVYVCFLAETSDGRMIDFRRISATKLQNGHEIMLSAELTDVHQYISCFVMCDDIAGTLRQAELRHDIPASHFPEKKTELPDNKCESKPAMNISRRRSKDMSKKGHTNRREIDEFEDDSLDDVDLIAAAQDMDYHSIKELDGNDDHIRTASVAHQREASGKDIKEVHASKAIEPVRLENGNWACNHRCKDKTSCKHFCCRDGTDRPPKTSRKQQPTSNGPTKTATTSKASRDISEWTKCQGPSKQQNRKYEQKGDVEIVDLCDDSDMERRLDTVTTTARSKKDTSARKQTRIEDIMGKVGSSSNIATPISYPLSKQSPLGLSLLDEYEFQGPETPFERKEHSSDYGNSWIDEDLPSPNTLLLSCLKKGKTKATNADIAIFVDNEDVPFHELDDGDCGGKTISPLALMKANTYFVDDNSDKPTLSPAKYSSTNDSFLSSSTMKPVTVGTNDSISTERTSTTALFPLHEFNSSVLDNDASDSHDLTAFINDNSHNKENDRPSSSCTKRPYGFAVVNDPMINDGDYGYDSENATSNKRRRYNAAEAGGTTAISPPPPTATTTFDHFSDIVDKPSDTDNREEGRNLENGSGYPTGREAVDMSLLEEFKDFVEFV
ncbi:ATP-dependent DNA helicase HFM1/MER3 [Blastomyces parvus]|uniref:DNA 3'-5' helicase n=1 Tax=Blastomyces parvus TaxID=2060905 RepID=A0A2B7X6S4_9EURO|nr:ATP-dependent DNA helicase HFM1/MER3 [Blastomyces parvus]